jgi:hypothetical protein
MELSYDPLTVFRKSRTPWGLYARQRWLGQGDDPVFQADINRAVGKLLADRTSDGLWAHSALTTIQRLFGLHLTRRDPDPIIDRALDRLMELAKEIYIENRTTHVEDLDPVALEGLPFTQSRSDVFITAAALFMGTVFGRADDRNILQLYGQLTAECSKTDFYDHDPSSFTNILRALVVHPEFASSPLVESAAAHLAERQEDSGRWEAPFPFFLTFNALAHLDSETAEDQIEKAVVLLLSSQNADGSWGRPSSEWETFLAVHGLKRKRADLLPG